MGSIFGGKKSGPTPEEQQRVTDQEARATADEVEEAKKLSAAKKARGRGGKKLLMSQLKDPSQTIDPLQKTLGPRLNPKDVA
tara:strand:- start:221 stop:466 length:246 start_codon:yes stop_codon:yes gene_type:complete